MRMIDDIKESLREAELKDELRLIIQEEISKAFDAAFSAATSYAVQPHQLNDEYRTKRKVQEDAVKEIGRAIKSALNKVKGEAEAKIAENAGDLERAKVIRATSDPSF